MDWKTRYEALVQQLNADEGPGIYPMGHLSKEERDGDVMKKTDAYKCGWNDAAMVRNHRLEEILEEAEKGISEDVTMLVASGNCFSGAGGGLLLLNMNDTWGWATGWCPEVPADQVAEVARLFRWYGRAGLMYWHSCQENDMRSEFHDNNRAIDFVRNEERICAETKDSNERAYRKVQYTIGDAPEQKEDK